MTDTLHPNTFATSPRDCPRVDTPHRRINTPIPAPGSLAVLEDSVRYLPQVNCYQPPVVWDRAEGYQIFDGQDNCWIDFSSGAVMANTGHGHPTIRQAVVDHARSEPLAQFNFASSYRSQLAKRLVELAPPGMDKVYFWTVGSEANEAAFRIARTWGTKHHLEKRHVVSLAGGYHGWTLAAHQLSGPTTEKNWLPDPDPAIHRLPFPRARRGETVDWPTFLEESVADLERNGVPADHIAAVFIETILGWGALPLPVPYATALRRWADRHDILLVFDEVQTGFGRTGRWFGHEHYGIRADLMCLGKGITSSLPLAAVLGPSDVMDVLGPAEVLTTHAGNPLCCAAGLANLEVIQTEGLVDEAQRKGEIAAAELKRLQARFPKHIGEVTGLGLVRALHVTDPQTGEPDGALAWAWTEAAVRRGVMVFQTTRPTLKVCPPLVIPQDAIVDGVRGLAEAFEDVLACGTACSASRASKGAV